MVVDSVDQTLRPGHPRVVAGVIALLVALAGLAGCGPEPGGDGPIFNICGVNDGRATSTIGDGPVYINAAKRVLTTPVYATPQSDPITVRVSSSCSTGAHLEVTDPTVIKLRGNFKAKDGTTVAAVVYPTKLGRSRLIATRPGKRPISVTFQVVAPAEWCRATKHKCIVPSTTTGSASSPPVSSARYRPSTDLLLVDAGRIKTVIARTGKIVHTVKLHGLKGTPFELSVSPGGKTAYAALRPFMCDQTEIIAINTATGQETVVLKHATNPALSPNGQFLAYTAAVPYPKRFGDPQGCATGPTYVRDLATGRTRSWNITTHPTGDLAAELVTSFTWASDNTHLVLSVTGADLPASLTEVLNTTQNLAQGNPKPVGGRIAYASPVLLPDRDLIGIAEPCPNNESCVDFPSGSTINTINPATGKIHSRRHTTTVVAVILVDPTGRRVEYVTAKHDTLTFQQLNHGRLTPIFSTSDLATYAWIPRSSPAQDNAVAPLGVRVGGVYGLAYPSDYVGKILHVNRGDPLSPSVPPRGRTRDLLAGRLLLVQSEPIDSLTDRGIDLARPGTTGQARSTPPRPSKARTAPGLGLTPPPEDMVRLQDNHGSEDTSEV